MNTKILTIIDDQSILKVFINTNDKLVLTIGDNSNNEFIQLIIIDHDDAIQLSKELKRLSNFI